MSDALEKYIRECLAGNRRPAQQYWLGFSGHMKRYPVKFYRAQRDVVVSANILPDLVGNEVQCSLYDQKAGGTEIAEMPFNWLRDASEDGAVSVQISFE